MAGRKADHPRARKLPLRLKPAAVKATLPPLVEVPDAEQTNPCETKFERM